MAEGREFIRLNNKLFERKDILPGQGQDDRSGATNDSPSKHKLQWLMVCCRESAGLYLSSQQFCWPIMT